MRAKPAVIIMGLAVLVGCAGQRQSGVRPAMLLWDVGINQKEGSSPLVETILPTTIHGRDAWRVVHRDPDPTSDGVHNHYDMYEVDRETLAPLRSVSDQDGVHLELVFAAGKVTIERREGERVDRTEAVVVDPMPEGPGLAVVLGALPLSPGYATSFAMVDRWTESEAQRVVQVDLGVSGPLIIATRLGRCQVLEVTLTPRNRAFQIREWVRAQPPHYSLRTEYTRGPLFLVSEVRTLVTDAPSSCAPPRQ